MPVAQKVPREQRFCVFCASGSAEDDHHPNLTHFFCFLVIFGFLVIRVSNRFRQARGSTLFPGSTIACRITDLSLSLDYSRKSPIVGVLAAAISSVFVNRPRSIHGAAGVCCQVCGTGVSGLVRQQKTLYDGSCFLCAKT